jgi:hypothetical protein
MATLNIGMKVNRTITGATTVNANATVIATYLANGFGTTPAATYGDSSFLNHPQGTPMVRVFGPAASVPASFTSTIHLPATNPNVNSVAVTVTWTLLSGVELINTQ